MDRDQIEQSEFIETLSRFEKMAFKICLEKTGNDWEVTQIIGDLNSPGTEFRSDVYSYGDVTFVQDVIPVEELCTWINESRGNLRDFNFGLPELRSTVRRERYSTGFAANHFYRLPYPFTLYTVSTLGNERQRDPFSPLVKSGLPSFPNFETAYYRYMFDRSYRPGEGISRDLVVIRVAHPEAWISAVEADSNAITVMLNGDQCEGTQLTIGGSTGILINELMERNGAHRFELKDPNFDNLWLVLSRGDSWVDWHDNRGSSRSTTWSVSGVQPANLAANMDHLRLQGENDQLEYKARVPDKQDKFLKTVAAFANGSGGIVLVGIADDGSVEGINEDANKYMDAIVNSIRNRIVPQPICELEKCVVDNRHVVAVFVKEGDEPPYGLNDKPPSIYVRRHGTTFDATPGEIRALGAKNQPSTSYSRPVEF